ncbi:MAG TPA: asparagine synthase (glutamine-hydrolyzing) [Candidatus Polarisedimenticolia bacterium]|nr:asparagine synthase (glutamine-hydrolyzing) [Candidatus Polarisedimenticolia bacterium]
MCGIAGFWGRADIDAATEILFHRGPDASGTRAMGPVSLGSRRLKVIDLKTGQQPMSNEDGKVTIVFNGMIFNYRELRRELEPCHQFRSRSDTEVIIHAYEEWGEKCLDRFIGMFAFAIWDGKELFLARDRMGEKPLYYTLPGGSLRFAFASEIKSLLTLVDAVPELGQEFGAFETSVGQDTLFKGIQILPPGCYLRFNGKSAKVRRYWEIPSFDGPYEKEEHYVEKLRWLIEDAVRLRLRSDVPVGVFLSGGLDSSLIACVAKPDVVFSCRYPYGPQYDEFEHAQKVARQIGAKHLVIQPTAADFKRDYPRILWHLDQPIATASSIGEFSLARLASEHVKVVLGGQGADECFGGYVRYLLMALEEGLGESPELKYYLPLARFFWKDEMFSDYARRYYHLIRRGGGEKTPGLERVRKAFESHAHLIDQIGRTDIELSLPSLITMNDRAAASWGLENRTPFLDHRIVELAFQLPPELKIRDKEQKVILRKVARGLVPDSVIDRKDKKGLIVPIQLWLSKELNGWAKGLVSTFKRRSLFRQVPREGPTRGEFDRRLYTLLSLELWHRNVLSVPRRKRLEMADRLRFRGPSSNASAVGDEDAATERSFVTAGP